MRATNPFQQYQQNAVLTADPGRLTLMLYNGAVRFTRDAVRHITAQDVPAAHEALVRAQDIVACLAGSVNEDYEVGRSLAALYDYIQRRLMEANTKKDQAIAAEAAGMLEELRDAWQQALESQGQSAPAAAAVAGGGR